LSVSAPLLPIVAGAALAPANPKPRDCVRNCLLLVLAVLASALVGVAGCRADAPASARPGTSAIASALPSVTPVTVTPVTPSAAQVRERNEFVGSTACVPCHRAQAEAYQSSHHEKALGAPSSEMAKARFDGGHFASKLGGTTKFSLRNGAPVVSSPVSGGKRATFPIAYVSGVWPLEQYVVATERGKLQSLGVLWDSRTPGENGAKWLHVYGKDGVAPSDTLFFTSPAQNWNHMCADCHSTSVERRYDPNADSFDTRWAELSVGCEACHGPGAEHVRSARAGGIPASLAVRLKHAEPWTPSGTGSPAPRPKDSVEVEVCAPCHSRREPLREGFVASDPFLDSFAPELLRPGAYHADGQVEGEVYEWGSFLQSRMYQAGVRCSDCHNPHSGKLYAEGNPLCVRCHEPARFEAEAHSHHTGATAPPCVDCHMPPATFMQIDERRDHSIRVPRPDHSVEFGVPNACNGCHANESASWAREWVAKWFPASPRRAHFVNALGKDRKGDLDAPRALRELAHDLAVPAIARATALERIGNYPAEKSWQTIRTALASAEPLVVYGAVLGAAQLPTRQRVPLVLPALEHPLRAVRIAAGKALAGVPAAELPTNARATLERVFIEVEQSFDVSASQVESQVERSAFELARGKLSAAEASLQTALRLQPCAVEAHLNLADLARQRRDEPAAERAIRSALACNPQNAATQHALGLWQVRARQTSAAIESFKRAVELAPTDTRFSYVLAVAMAGRGEREHAIRILEAVLTRRSNDATALNALAGYLRESGQTERAVEVRQKLETLQE
jgi:predicted CXXCH cytochrome family protein